jgi:allophanate hydrolase subunit 2
MTIIITSVGYASLQDTGRPGYEALGVPRSGAFDSFRYRLALNLIAGHGNVIEILHGHLTARTDRDIVVGLVGPGQVTFSGDVTVPAGTAVLIPANTSFTVTTRHSEGLAYLAVSGLHAPHVLGSVATDSFSGLGTPRLHAGQTFDLDDTQIVSARAYVGAFVNTHADRGVSMIRYVPGPHLDGAFLDTSWSVKASARTGVRLTSPDVTPPADAGNLPSLPVVPGAIQVTPAGEAIILGPDSGVTGGYPLAGVVISADLHRIARLTEGTSIRLVPVTTQDAEQAWQSQEKYLAHAVVAPFMMGAW